MVDSGSIGNSPNIVLSQLKMAQKSGPFSVKSSNISQLNLRLGDIVLAHFIRQEEGQSLLFRIGDQMVKAFGQIPGLKEGQMFFLKVIDLGPPLRLQPMELQDDENLPLDNLYTRLRTALLGMDLGDQAIETLLGATLDEKIGVLGLLGQKTSPSDIALFFLLKEAMADLFKEKGAELGGEGDDDHGPSNFIRLIKGILKLEQSLQKGPSSLDLVMAPIFFENGEGKGLLAIYRRKEGEKGGGEGKDKGSAVVSIEFELFMSRIGQLRILAGLKEKRVDLIIRVRDSYQEHFKKRVKELVDRLKNFGFSVVVNVYGLDSLNQKTAFLGEGRRDGLFEPLSKGTLHLIA